MLQRLQLVVTYQLFHVIVFYLHHAVGFMQVKFVCIFSSSIAVQAAAMASSAYVNKLRSGSVTAGEDVLGQQKCTLQKVYKNCATFCTCKFEQFKCRL